MDGYTNDPIYGKDATMQKTPDRWTLRSKKSRDSYLKGIGKLYGDDQEKVVPEEPKAKRSPYKRNLTPYEADVQAAIVEWCEVKGLPIISIPNHGKRSFWEGLKQKRMGLRKGVSDLFLAKASKRYHGCWLEIKRSGEVPTIAQWEWIYLMRKEGYFADYYDNFDDAIKAIEAYLKDGDCG